jgi:hypothetical protein
MNRLIFNQIGVSMVKHKLFSKSKSGYLVQVVQVRKVWRCHIFSPNGHFSSIRFAAPSAAVQFAKFFLASVSGNSNKNQLQLF